MNFLCVIGRYSSMDSVESAQLLKLSSTEGFSYECSPCNNDGLVKEAKFYCSECTEYMCDSCESSHRRFRGTRQHQIVSGDAIPLTSSVYVGKSVTQSSTLCTCNVKEVTIFCKDHNDVICTDCKTLHHRGCDCISVDEESIGFKNSIANDTIAKADKLIKRIEELLNEQKDILGSLLIKIKGCLEEIHNFREQLIAQIHLMDTSSSDEVDRLAKFHKKSIQQKVDTFEIALGKIVSRKNFLLLSRNTSEDKIKFIGNIRLAKDLESIGKVINDVSKEINKPDINFVRSTRLCGIQTDQTLGEVKLETTTMKIIANMKVASAFKIDTEIDNAAITGSVFMPSGELCLCNYTASTIRILNNEFSFKEELKLEGVPWDVAVINEENVLITMPNEKKLHYVQVRPKLQLGGGKNLDKKCWGVEVYKGDFYVSCHNNPGEGEIRVFDNNFLLKTRIGLGQNGEYMFSNSLYITISYKGEILISDDGLKSITRMPNDGSLAINTYKINAKNPVGILVDGGNNVIICCRNSNTIHVPDESGIETKTIQITSESMKPLSVCFRQADNILVVTSDCNSSTYALKME